MPQVAGIRRFGAAALDLAWVAAGRYDGYWELGIKPWDMAAGLLIVREAGGYATDPAGGDPRARTATWSPPTRICTPGCAKWWRRPARRPHGIMERPVRRFVERKGPGDYRADA